MPRLPIHLRVLRHVRDRPESEDSTPGQRDARAWAAADPVGFGVYFAALEFQFLAKCKRRVRKKKKARPVGRPGVPVEPVRKADGAAELAARLLGELRGESNGRGDV